MVRAAARAGTHRVAKSGLISSGATHLFEETIKTMFLTRIRIGVARRALGRLSRRRRSRRVRPAAMSGRPLPEMHRAGKSALSPASAPPPPELAAAPAYIRRSRTMIIEHLERELALAQERLERTKARVRSI